MTNGEKLRAMNDDDLAFEICEMYDGKCEHCPGEEYCHDGHNGLADWLKKEANGGGCDTCKHGWGEENCKGCLWDGKAQRNTHLEPFINKPCVSEGVCHEDKMKVLEKIKAEIEQDAFKDVNGSKYISVNRVNQIINKYTEEVMDDD